MKNEKNKRIRWKKSSKMTKEEYIQFRQYKKQGRQV